MRTAEEIARAAVKRYDEGDRALWLVIAEAIKDRDAEILEALRKKAHGFEWAGHNGMISADAVLVSDIEELLGGKS